MITLKQTELNELELEKKVKRKAKKKNEEPVVETPVIDENKEAVKDLTDSIRLLVDSKDNSPDMQGVLSAIERIQQTQTELIAALGSRPEPEPAVRDWEFAVERDNKGAIKKIYAKGA